MMTPKAGETWILLECRKHRQLRDVVLVGRSFEDQPPEFQEGILERIRCGCEYRAEDPEAAIRDLRLHERKEELEMRSLISATMAECDRESRNDRLVVFLVLVLLAILMFSMIFVEANR